MIVDREYVEIYPLHWNTLDHAAVRSITGQRSELENAGICIYVHVPFCTVICPFCGFSKQKFQAALYQRYVSALLKELSLYYGHPDAENREVNAIYFGGGTGSLLEPRHVADIMRIIHASFKPSPNAQVTMECYPTTLNREKLHKYRKAGITRISLGIQTFDNEFLESVGRGGSIDGISNICAAIREEGFDNLRIDLMYRLPGQTIKQLQEDIERFLEIEPNGISTYSLETTGTSMQGQDVEIPADEMDREMFYFIGNFLYEHGYLRFAQPDFAKPGCEDAYVLNAWAAPQGLLLGVGPGAHTHYFGGHVYANVCSVDQYISGIEAGCFPGTVGAPVSHTELMHKYMVLGVRCLTLDKTKFRELFEIEIENYFEDQVAYAIAAGWLSDEGDTLKVTEDGLWYVDNLSKIFYSSNNMDHSQPRGKKLSQYQELVSLVSL